MTFSTLPKMGFPTQKESARSVQPFLSCGASKVHTGSHQVHTGEEKFRIHNSGLFDTTKHGCSQAPSLVSYLEAVPEIWGFKSTCFSTVSGANEGGKFQGP